MRLPSITVAPHLQGYEAATTWVAELGSNHLHTNGLKCSSYCGLVDDPFFIRTTAKHTARVRERRACSDVVKELSWDVS